MFETLESFCVVFFTLAAILLLMLIFEDQLLQLEDKYDEWHSKKIKERRARHENRGAAQSKKSLQKKM